MICHDCNNVIHKYYVEPFCQCKPIFYHHRCVSSYLDFDDICNYCLQVNDKSLCFFTQYLLIVGFLNIFITFIKLYHSLDFIFTILFVDCSCVIFFIFVIHLQHYFPSNFTFVDDISYLI